MRRFLLLTCMLILATGCAKRSPVDPQDGDPYQVVAQEIIGPSGGTIEADDFSLQIPSGAFAGEQTVKLHAATEIRPFGADQVTRAFRLTGIPDRFTRPLWVRIKYEGTLSEETYIAHGMTVLDEAMRDERILYHLISAPDSSGFLVCEIPAAQEGGRGFSIGICRPRAKAADSADAFDLLGLTGFRTHQTGHFAIKYPVSLVEVNIPAVGAMLEELQAAIAQTMQLRWPWTGRIQTIVMQLDAGQAATGDYHSSPADRALLLNGNDLSQGHIARVRLAAGRILLLNLLWVLDPAAGQLPNFWLRHAVADWAEEHFTEDTAFRRPSTFSGEVEMAPFFGMTAGSVGTIEDGLDHGHGMAAVIKYLADDGRFTAAGVGRTYATISQGGSSAAAALLNNVEALVAEWWPQFFKSYVGGEIYGVSKNVFTDSRNLAGTWTIAGHADTLRTFAGSYPDLSAKLYMINLSTSDLDESAALTLRLSGQSGYHAPWGVMAFGVGGESLAHWGHSVAQGSATLRVPGLKGLYDAGWRQILVVAVCSNTSSTYLESTDGELEARITKAEPSAAYNSFDFGLLIVGQWRHTSGTYTNEYQGDLDEEPWGSVDVIPGEMATESRFEGRFAAQGASGEVTAMLNAARDTLLAVQLDMRAADTDGRTRQFSFRAAGVPRWFEDDDWTMFRATGTEACRYLEDVLYEYLYPGAAESLTLLGYHCTGAGTYPSTLHISFHKRPR